MAKLPWHAKFDKTQFLAPEKGTTLIFQSRQIAIMITLLTCLAGTSLFAINTPSHAQSGAYIELNRPVDCTVGETCYIENYVDLDPSRRWKNYRCSGRTFDGNRSTDFRLNTTKKMDENIIVRAAAAGRIKAFRNSDEDGLYANGSKEAVRNRECGNTVIIEHENGWETQYCHLKQNSARAIRGLNVKPGDKIGLVGMSGKAEGPKLGFIVRHNDQTMDPFIGVSAMQGCSGSAEATPLWAVGAIPHVLYYASDSINDGFTIEPPDLQTITEKGYNPEADYSKASTLYYSVQIFGIKTDDVQEISLTGPDGSILSKQATLYEDKSRSQFLHYITQAKPETGWQSGQYKGSYKLIRYGKVVIEESETIEIGTP